MFGIGMTELLVIMAVALVVFGPKRLPELARSMGRALGEFRQAGTDLRQTLGETPPAAAPSDPAPPESAPPASTSARTLEASSADDDTQADERSHEDTAEQGREDGAEPGHQDAAEQGHEDAAEPTPSPTRHDPTA